MADALIGATIQVTLETVLSLATDRNGLLFGFKKDLASMTRSLGLIRDVMSDAEEKHVQDRAVQKWLKNLEGVAFDAENVLDELNYHFLRHEVEYRNQLKRKVCIFFAFSNCNIAFHRRMASKVRNIKIKLDNINQEANQLGLVSRLAIRSTIPVTAAGDTRSRQTDSVVAPIIGRANDESKIVKKLLSPSEKIISVIPIIGMAGLGKTTLTKSIYNNKEIDGHFQVKIWVCVSKEVQILELFKLILVQLTGEKFEVDDRNVIVDKIGKKLGDKRYFLVLDDVWNLEYGFWDDVFITLNGVNSANGSWCLVTTRLEHCARLLMIDVEPYFLGRLTDNDCWSILKEKAIGEGEEPEELKAIRDRVTKRCDGLPLAASVIGGLLHLSAKEEWSSIVEKSLLIGDQRVEQILKVSFDYLSPASVKKCFAYCSIFPKDTEMEKDSLIELWMAAGFLMPGLDKEIVMEKIGDTYLRVLLQSSLFQEIRSDDLGVCYIMHDLVHDLAESISKSKSINLEAGVINNNFQVRYLVLNSFGEKTLKHFENISTSLRTLILGSGMPSEMLAKFKNLHVLCLYVTETRELPTTIDKLIHLRYFDLSYSEIKTLSESLCKLYNLQTLRLIGCNNLKVLPKGMSNLISLRHLHYYSDDESFQMPLEMGQLTCLQTLEFFNIGQEKGRGIEELGCLNDLKGKLEIRNLELIKDKQEAEKANLIGMEDLFRLELLWSSTNRESDNSCDEEVLEGLRPYSNLQELVIENYLGDQFPQWFMHLSRLVDLELTDCNGCRELPNALGRLSSLQNLKLWKLESIRSIGLSFYGIDKHSNSFAMPITFFPALKTLLLSKMENLVEWMGAEELRSLTTTTTGGGGESQVLHTFPMLESLIIEDCSKLTTIPGHFPSLKELELKFCENLRELLLEDLFEFRSLRRLKIKECPRIVITNPEALSNLTSLEELWITGCYELTKLPCKMPKSLVELRVCNCTNLVSFLLNLQQTPSLSIFDLYGCTKLKTNMTPKRFDFLTNLQQLIIGPFLDDDDDENASSVYNEFDWSGLKYSSTLRELTLYALPHMESLPHQLQYLTTLTELYLCDFGGIEALPDWIGNLESLQVLYLWNCDKLRCLPSMDAMRRLTKLTYLRVTSCPLLKERCNPNCPTNFSEWSKIAHISNHLFD